MSKEKEATVPWHYYLHVSLLHAKVAMITGTNAKRRLTWGNGSDMRHGLSDVGLPTEQLLPSRPRGQMLMAKFLSLSGCDTWLPTSMTSHPSCNVDRITADDLTDQPLLANGL